MNDVPYCVGIQFIFFAWHEEREKSPGAVHTQFVVAWRDPSQELVMVAFGQYSQLVVIETKVTPPLRC